MSIEEVLWRGEMVALRENRKVIEWRLSRAALRAFIQEMEPWALGPLTAVLSGAPEALKIRGKPVRVYDDFSERTIVQAVWDQ